MTRDLISMPFLNVCLTFAIVDKIRDPHYVARFYNEHRANFEEFFDGLLQMPTILKLIRNARGACMQINQRNVPPEYVVRIDMAYQKMEDVLQMTQNKKLMLNLIRDFFEVISKQRFTEGAIKDLIDYFGEEKALVKMRPWTEVRNV